MEKMGKMYEVLNEQMSLTDEDCGCNRIARLQSLAVAVKDSYVVLERSDDEEFEDLLQSLSAGDVESLKELYPDDQIFKYRNVNGIPLKGLIISSDDEVVVDFKDLPDDHMIPEVIELQRNFVAHRLVAKCRKKIFMMVNRDISRAEMKEMSPERLRRLMRLTDMLIDTITEQERTELGLDQGRDRLKKLIDEKIVLAK